MDNSLKDYILHKLCVYSGRAWAAHTEAKPRQCAKKAVKDEVPFVKIYCKGYKGRKNKILKNHVLTIYSIVFRLLCIYIFAQKTYFYVYL